MNKARNKDLRELIKQAEKQGFNVKLTSGGHYRWTAPNGVFFFSASSPSDARALKNITQYLRINGFVELKKKKGRR